MIAPKTTSTHRTAHPLRLLGDAFGAAPHLRPGRHFVRWADGSTTPLDVARWTGEPTAEEHDLLDRAVGPVLDVGCGPGRHVQALNARGVDALGIDVVPEAVRAGRLRGAPVIQASVFDAVPRARQWRSALLLDGNVGIGGDPAALLRRVRELLRPDGRVFVECEAPGVGLATSYGSLETPRGTSMRFPWGRVGADALDQLADHGGFVVGERWTAGERWFACLVARNPATDVRDRTSGRRAGGPAGMARAMPPDRPARRS